MEITLVCQSDVTSTNRDTHKISFFHEVVHMVVGVIYARQGNAAGYLTIGWRLSMSRVVTLDESVHVESCTVIMLRHSSRQGRLARPRHE